MALKNQNLASANPGSIANRAYIDALYLEKEGRKATDREYSLFKDNTVKDAANRILGLNAVQFGGTPQPVQQPASSTPKPLTNESDVKLNFQKYIGRVPTSQADLNTVQFLMTKSPTEVESRLKSSMTPASQSQPVQKQVTLSSADGSQKTVVISGSPEATQLQNAGWKVGDVGIKAVNKDDAVKSTTLSNTTQTLLRQIDSDEKNGVLTKAQATAARSIIQNGEYTSGQKVYSPEELDKAFTEELTKAHTELDPYYSQKKTQDIQDLTTGMADISNESARYQQQEAASYADTLNKTKQSLRARGLTFSGSSRGTLGKEGALQAEGVEGTLPQERRYNWEDKRAGFQEKARDLGTAAERLYGSDTIGAVQDKFGGIADPYANGLDYVAGRTSPDYLVKKKDQPNYIKTGTIESDKAKEERLRAEERVNAKYKLYT